jgi:bilirubin oxidase
MQFGVTTQTTDPVTLYANLPANADINTRLTEGEATASRTFIMSQAQGGGSGGGMRFVINGLSFDINRIDETVLSGATEIWEISNTSGMAHPFHAHAIQWQILDRGQSNSNLVPATGIDLGWKDTVLVEPNETVRFIGKFDPNVNSGLYMYHCHILEHEDNGMMGTFQVLQ